MGSFSPWTGPGGGTASQWFESVVGGRKGGAEEGEGRERKGVGKERKGAGGRGEGGDRIAR